MTFFDLIHFEQVYWLALIPLTILVSYYYRRQGVTKGNLQEVIDEKLLPHLQIEPPAKSHKRNLLPLTLCFLWVALAGISWSKQTTTMFNSSAKTIFIVDQSLSMYSTDIAPNRQTQLKQSVRDILQQIQGREMAMVAFAGEAYVISPFTQDKNTLTHFLLALEPLIMPVYGSQLMQGIDTALTLEPNLDQPLHFVILTDDISQMEKAALHERLAGRSIKLDLIAIGTPQGGTVALPNGQILRDKGQVIKPPTPLAELKDVTEQLGGHYYHGRLSVQQTQQIAVANASQDSQQEADNQSLYWQSQAHWFAIPFLIWLALAFRKGALLSLAFILFFPFQPLQASPLEWFLTPDQRGQKLVDEGNWQEAQKLFQDPQWQAASSYALEDYDAAASTLSSLPSTAKQAYNLGNSLALNGQFEEAINAYEEALKLDPELSVAKQNLAYLKQLQQNQQQDPSSQDSQQSSSANAENKQDQEQASDNQQSEEKSENSQNNEEKQDKPASSEDNKEAEQEQPAANQQEQQAKLSQEESQALKQWLRQIQDDPGTLLQRKLWHLHQEKQRERPYGQQHGQQPW
ncbi:vWA domain-containing protein [Marinomonas epiphytica]